MSDVTRACKRCGDHIPRTRDTKALYCTDLCMRQAHGALASRPAEFTCQHCGKTRPTPQHGPVPRYCPTKCPQQASHLRRKADGRIAAELERKKSAAAAARPRCENCGGQVKSLRSAFCMSEECRRLARERELALKRAATKAKYYADPQAARLRMVTLRANMTPEQKASALATAQAWAAAQVSEEVACQHCGGLFARSRTHPEIRFCGRRCAIRNRYAQRPKRAPAQRYRDLPEASRSGLCAQCGERFIKSIPTHAYCSEECVGRAHSAQARIRRKAMVPTFVGGCCPRCGAAFVDRWQAEQSSRYCSEACSKGASRDRRRARKRMAFVADVHRHKIFERDRWLCHLCGKRLRRLAVAPHPLSPTLDHVIPLAKGGTHEPANVRAAHFICNSTKGDRGGGEQMLLFGA